jgi:small-conductance mechanosensitive channel
MLSKVHAHLFLTGMFVFLFTALAAARIPLEKQKSFRTFMILYNIGVPLTAVMMVVRGVLQVNGTELTSAMDSMISGIAGIGHILLGIGLLCLLAAAYQAGDQ